MRLFLQMLAIVSPIFLTMGLGYLALRVRVVSEKFVADAHRLIYMIGLPLLLFHTIGRANFSTALNGPQILGAALAFCLLFVLAVYFPAMYRAAPAKRAAFAQSSIRGNMSYIGLAVVLSAYGQEGLVTAGVFLGFMVGLLNVLCILALLVPSGKAAGRSPTFWIKQVAYNPIILAGLAGLLWSGLDLPMPKVLDETLSIVSGMTLPLALITVGAGFKASELAGDLYPAAWSAFLKLLVTPAVVGAMIWLLGGRGMDVSVAVVLTAAPTSSASLVLADQLGGDKHLTTSTVVLSTLLAVLTMTLVLSAVGWLGIG